MRWSWRRSIEYISYIIRTSRTPTLVSYSEGAFLSDWDVIWRDSISLHSSFLSLVDFVDWKFGRRDINLLFYLALLCSGYCCSQLWRHPMNWAPLHLLFIQSLLILSTHRLFVGFVKSGVDISLFGTRAPPLSWFVWAARKVRLVKDNALSLCLCFHHQLYLSFSLPRFFGTSW